MMISVFGGINFKERRVKFTTDRDCLPVEIENFALFTSTGDPDNVVDMRERFYKYYELKGIFESLGMMVTIDFGQWYYETGGSIRDNYSKLSSL